MNRIQKSARTFVKRYSLTSFNINSVKYLTEIALKQGYKIYRFADFENDELLSRLGITKQHTDSITFINNNLKCIFIKKSVSENYAAALLLHELAHIELEHLTASMLSDSDEIEADMFVSCIWEELLGESKKTVLKYAAIPYLLVLAALILALYSYKATLDFENNKGEAVSAVVTVTETSSADFQKVYVTKSGKKYHKATCRHIKNRDTIAIDIKEAEGAGYEPCKDCFQ